MDSEQTASCPARAAIELTERLFVPHRKRLSHTYVTDLLASFAIGSGVGAFPYIFDSLERALAFQVDCTVNAIDVSDRRAS